MSSLLNSKYFKYTFFLLVLAEVLSYLGWAYNWLNAVCFIAILLATLVLSFKKLEWGIYILFAELFIGSKAGALFSLPVGGFNVSLRMGIFVAVILSYCASVVVVILRTRRLGGDEGSRGQGTMFTHKVWRYFHGIPRRPAVAGILGMTLVILWGLIWGLLRGNNLSNVFFDFNNWLYFLIILPVLSIISRCHPELVSGLYNSDSEMPKPSNSAGRQVRHDKQNYFFHNILSIMLAAALVTALETIGLFYLFTHNFAFVGSDIYRWIRDTGVGEITVMGGEYFAFFSSHRFMYYLLF